MDFYDKRPYFDRVSFRIPQYTDGRTGKAKDRKLRAQPGMAELVNIVAGLQKDVKRINKCLTIDGANEYVAKRPGWEAIEQDITGPEGKPDGIPEVIVTDKKGNIKVINGYHLAKGTYPKRKLYQTMKQYLHEQNPDGGPYQYAAFNQDLYKIHEGFDNDGNPYYENEIPTGFPTYFKAHIPRQSTPSAKELFKQYIFNPVYDDHRASLKDAVSQVSGQPGMIMAQVFNNAFRASFKGIVLKDVYASYQINLKDIERNEKVKKKFDKDHKTGIEDKSMNILKQILNDDNKLNEVQETVNAIITDVASEELAKAQMNNEQLDAFRNQSQNITTHLQRFGRGVVDHSASRWGVQPRTQTELSVSGLDVPDDTVPPVSDDM